MHRIEERLKKYELELLRRRCLAVCIIIMLVIIFYQGFIAEKPSNLVIFLLLLSFSFLLYIRIKRPELLDLTLQQIITEDCDAESWIAFLNKHNKKKSLSQKIEYCSALNLIGQAESALIKLIEIKPNKIKVIEQYVSYIFVMNDTCFYLKDLSRLKHLKKIIAKENNKDKKIARQLMYIKLLNQYYIACLENEVQVVPEIKELIQSATTKLEKVKLAYLLYLTTIPERECDDHKKAITFILENGGTTFFVTEINNKVKNDPKETER